MQAGQRYGLWKWVSLCFLSLGGLVGLLLRFSFVRTPFEDFNFRYWLHAHSHLMLLGWLFNAAFISLTEKIFPEGPGWRYRGLFWFFQFANAGMLLTFPVTGYSAASITFSTLHILLSFVMTAWLLRDDSGSALEKEGLRWALGFLFLSSAGPFLVGILSAQGMQGTVYYDLAIYYYLHFQYNGWLVFAFLAAWYPFAGGDPLSIRYNIRLLGAAVLLSFSLSALWLGAGKWLMAVGLFSAFLQVFALLGLFRVQKGTIARMISNVQPALRPLVWLVAAAVLGKLLLQVVSAFPAAMRWYYFDRNVPIGYMHLVFLGIFTPLTMIIWFRNMPKENRLILGISSVLFMAGFLFSESLIAGEAILRKITGNSIPQYFPGLAAASGILVVSFLLFLWLSGRSLRSGSEPPN